jgi:hypothetical protein
LYRVQPLLDGGYRCGVGVHGGALRECLRIMLTATHTLNTSLALVNFLS